MYKVGDKVKVSTSFGIGDQPKGAPMAWNEDHQNAAGQIATIKFATGKDVMIPFYQLEEFGGAFCAAYLEPVKQAPKSKKSVPLSLEIETPEEYEDTMTFSKDNISIIITELQQFKDSLEPHIEDRTAFRDLFFKHLKLVLKTH